MVFKTTSFNRPANSIQCSVFSVSAILAETGVKLTLHPAKSASEAHPYGGTGGVVSVFMFKAIAPAFLRVPSLRRQLRGISEAAQAFPGLPAGTIKTMP